MAQSVERRIGSAEVTGPIPVSSSSYLRKEISKFLENKGFHGVLGFFLRCAGKCGYVVFSADKFSSEINEKSLKLIILNSNKY